MKIYAGARRLLLFPLLLVVLLLTHLPAWAVQPGVVADLRHEWLYLHSGYDGLVPYMPQEVSGVHTLFMKIPLRDYGRYQLYVRAQAGSVLFLDNRLSHTFHQQGAALFSLDSLAALQPQVAAGQLLLAIYHPEPVQELPEVRVMQGARLLRQQPAVSEDAAIQLPGMPLPRPQDDRQSYLFATGVFILLMMGLSVRLTDLDYGIREHLQLVLNTLKDRGVEYRKSGLGSVVFFLVYSLVMAYVLLVFAPDLPGAPLFEQWGVSPQHGSVLSQYGLLVLVGATLLAVRLLLMGAMGGIYSVRQLRGLHWQEYMQLSQFMLFAFMLVAAFCALYPLPMVLQVGKIAIVTGMVARSLLVSMGVSGQLSLSNNYLFSYFCTTELVPMLILAKLFF